MKGSSFSLHAPTVLILIQFATYMNSYSLARPMPSEADTDFIKSSCGATTYPDLCFTSLSSYATEIQSNPKLLAITALSVSLNITSSSSATMKKLSETQGLTPRESAAMQDCVEELSDSVDEFQRSISEMGLSGGKNFALEMSNVQTWVSAALTDADTCMDGFSGNPLDGSVKTTVRNNIVNVAHVTSNALALINNYASSNTP